MKYKQYRGILCSRCGEAREIGRLCRKCHAANMRAWRKDRELTDAQKFKALARSYAGIYKRRGLIAKEPCEACGAAKAEMHHEDYNKPLEVIWLCRSCHLALHRQMKAAA